MTITYSIWQGSKLISIDNIATEPKAIDHIIASLNESELGKIKKFTANVMDIKVGKWCYQQCTHTHASHVETQGLLYLTRTQQG